MYKKKLQFKIMYIFLSHFSVFGFIGTTELYLLKLHTCAFSNCKSGLCI